MPLRTPEEMLRLEARRLEAEVRRLEKIKKLKEAIERRKKDNQPLKRASPVQRANPNRNKWKLRLA